MKKYFFSISIACIANMSMRSFTVLCEAKKEPGDWLADLARKGKDAMGSKSFDFQTLISSDSSEKVREFARDLLRPEKVGQISYGFAAGFASGYCIKKVAKAAAFAVGGLFIIVQTLAYNGYLTVNQDRIKEEFEVRIIEFIHTRSTITEL